ncbi:MAG: dTDP-4-dehydrorhamnose 3,5-epimerase [Gammaproteobacteria bacterium]
MRVKPAQLADVLIIEPQSFEDERGFFFESWNRQRYAAAGIDVDFVQDNHARSVKGVLRGLHAQHPHDQGKLVRALNGEIFDVAVDIRKGSPAFGKWVGIELSATNRRQFFVPPGFAHGYCVLSTEADVEYKCTDYYSPDDEITIAWNDPDIGIEWPLTNPIVSSKDIDAQTLKDLAHRLPQYG